MVEMAEAALIEPRVLGDALRFLHTLVEEAAEPGEALRAFRRFQENASVPMDLVWEAERYARVVNYDLLLHLPERGSVSLSFCADRAVPWPLRHAHNPEANVVVRVNNEILNNEQVMAYLDFIWDQAPVVVDLIDKCLIREAIQKRAIAVSDDELQDAMDAFRRRHGLYTAASMHEWLARRGTTQERLEAVLAGEAAAARLKDQIAGEGIEAYFERHRADFDAARIARFHVASETAARHVHQRIRRGELSFFEAAQEAHVAQVGTGDGRMFALVRRGSLAPDQAALLFSAAPGEVIGPIPVGDGFDLVRVARVEPACLDEATREAIKGILFRRWLEERRAQSSVEWFWGRNQVVSR